ncbi:hypothetical protein RHS01_00337 [Rhizoctonia solani]|uniref:Uncharacterized protein n=1 Tax=Rhizoctonia solani TaxID=456999 RepID=A0A8H7IN45_9AGAM|nr:hypothetical protein RHS01_00337 [Rhizoctonia solani]
MTSLVCSRIYTLQSTSGFRDQINIWSDRVQIHHIQFNTSETTYLDKADHKLYRAVPILPKIIVLGGNRAQYDERFAMVPTDAQIGWGTSIRKAEENSAQNLMMSGYCVKGGSSTRPSDHAYTPFRTLTKPPRPCSAPHVLNHSITALRSVFQRPFISSQYARLYTRD